jgi:hypothetical protein
MLMRATRHFTRLLLAAALAAGFSVPLAAQDGPTPDPIASFAATATALAGGSSAPSGQVTIAPEQVTPVSTPVPEATAEATPEVTAEATAEATAEVTPEATAEATPEATEEATAEPVAPSGTVAVTPPAGETDDSGEDAGAAGTTTLVLLIGLGAVLAVGGLTLLRERYENKEDKSGA